MRPGPCSCSRWRWPDGLHAASGRRGRAVPDPAHNSRNSLDWAGIYEGVLPCADCPGIQTRLTLSRDESVRTQHAVPRPRQRAARRAGALQLAAERQRDHARRPARRAAVRGGRGPGRAAPARRCAVVAAAGAAGAPTRCSGARGRGATHARIASLDAHVGHRQPGPAHRRPAGWRRATDRLRLCRRPPEYRRRLQPHLRRLPDRWRQPSRAGPHGLDDDGLRAGGDEGRHDAVGTAGRAGEDRTGARCRALC